MTTIPSPLVIKPAAPADEPAIRALLQEAGLPHEDFAAHLGHFLVARLGGKVVGAVGLELYGTDALLRSLVVAPTQRGTGLGGRLLGRLEDAAEGWGARTFFLLTTTAESYFLGRGFVPVARSAVPPAIAATVEFAALCPASSACLTRAVRP